MKENENFVSSDSNCQKFVNFDGTKGERFCVDIVLICMIIIYTIYERALRFQDRLASAGIFADNGTNPFFRFEFENDELNS